MGPDRPGSGATGGGPHIGGFESFELVGWGGFGAVYRAYQPALNRHVAVKVLAAAGLDDRVRRRFEREQLAMGSLSSHPGIVTLYQAGFTDEGLPFLAMELMEGGSLGERVAASGPLGWEAAAQIVGRIATAVEAAHEVGVLHRDIKPDNILMSRYGEAKLTDFGIAALMEGTATATTSVTATVEHAAPEVLGGRQPTEAADVYSLGSTFFTLLAGHSPFRVSEDESVISIIGRVATQPVPDLRDEGIPDAVCGVIEASLAKDPADRIPTMAEFTRRLHEAAAAAAAPAERAAAPTAAVIPPSGEPAEAAEPEGPDRPTGPAHGAAGDATRAIPRAPQPEPEPQAEPAKRSRMPWILGIGGAVAAVAVIAIVALAGGGEEAPETTAAAPATTGTTATTSTTVAPTTTTLLATGPEFTESALVEYVGLEPDQAADAVATEIALSGLQVYGSWDDPDGVPDLELPWATPTALGLIVFSKTDAPSLATDGEGATAMIGRASAGDPYLLFHARMEGPIDPAGFDVDYDFLLESPNGAVWEDTQSGDIPPGDPIQGAGFAFRVSHEAAGTWSLGIWDFGIWAIAGTPVTVADGREFAVVAGDTIIIGVPYDLIGADSLYVPGHGIAVTVYEDDEPQHTAVWPPLPRESLYGTVATTTTTTSTTTTTNPTTTTTEAPQRVSVSVSPSSGTRDTKFTVSASGLTPNRSVRIQVGSGSWTRDASGSGSVSISVSFGAGDPSGTYTVRVTDQSTGASGSASLTLKD